MNSFHLPLRLFNLCSSRLLQLLSIGRIQLRVAQGKQRRNNTMKPTSIKYVYIFHWKFSPYQLDAQIINDMGEKE